MYGPEKWGIGPPVVADGVVYVGVASDVIALDAAEGTKLWEFDCESIVSGEPVAVLNDHVLAVTQKGRLEAIESAA